MRRKVYVGLLALGAISFVVLSIVSILRGLAGQDTSFFFYLIPILLICIPPSLIRGYDRRERKKVKESEAQ